ncbi:hypothetical protein J7M22_11645 [Candidatus Poribacteria bacterium]|nr:hypothetical protein [Candidatus Poribacteria bacterium]
MDQVSDEELVRKVLGGDRDAFSALVERYKDMVYGVAYAHLRNFHDARRISESISGRHYMSSS